MSDRLVQAFVSEYPDHGEGRADLEARLRSWVEDAVRHWPDLRLDDAALGRGLAQVVRDAGCFPERSAAADVVLAIGCATGEPAALRLFDRHYVQGLEGILADRSGGRDRVDEVHQRLRTRLLTGRPPAILRYAGQGRLAGLVRVAATRLALNLRRDEQRRTQRQDELAADWLSDAVDDPELDRIKRQHARAFKDAFQGAVAELSPRQRTLLRLHLLERLSIDEIGSIYGAHRSTAARWLARAREVVADRTRERLAEGLRGEPDLEQLMGLVRSRLDLSLSRVLGRAPPRE